MSKLKPKQIIIYLFCASMLCSITILAQNKMDSLLNLLDDYDGKKKYALYNEITIKLMQTEQDKALEIALLALNYAKEKNNYPAIAISFENLGDIYFDKGNYTEAFFHFKESNSIYTQINDSSNIAKTMDKMANIYYQWNNYLQALELYQNALLIKETIGQTADIAFSINAMGNIYFQLRNFPKALELYNQAYKIEIECDNKKGISYALNAIGDVYFQLKQHDKALEKYNTALQILLITNELQGIAYSYEKIGLVYLSAEKLEKAEYFLTEALNIYAKLENKNTAPVLNLLGNLNKMKANFDKANTFYTNGLNSALQKNDKKTALEIYKNIANLYFEKKDFQKAYIYQNKYALLYDSVFNQNTNYKIAELQTKYELKTKEKEIQILSHQQEVKDLLIRKKNKNILILSLLIAILIVSGIALYNRAKYKLKSANAIKAEIKERKKTEALLKASEERFELAMKGANDGLWDWNIVKNTVYFSPRWKDMLGYNPEEISDNTAEWFERIHPDDRADEQKMRMAHIDKQTFLYEAEYRMKHKTDSYIWVHARGIAIFLNDSPTRMVGTISNITQRKKYENELEQNRANLRKLVRSRTFSLEIAKKKVEQSDQLKTAFLKNISHEIRTPMNAIVGFSNLLLRPNITADERNDYSNKIFTNCNALIKLFDDIIFVSKIQTGEIRVNLKSFDINQTLSEIYNNFNKTYFNNNTQIKLYLELGNITPGFNCVSDSILIQQTIENLLKNAIKFTDKGIIKFGYNIVDNDLLFFVQDSGIGIPDDKKGIIFERFRKIEDNMEHLYRGIGLGLTICKSIIEMLEGKIWLESKINVGTTFFFKIPLKTNI